MTRAWSEPPQNLVLNRYSLFEFRFFFKPLTLTALAVAMSILAYIAMSDDVLEEGMLYWYHLLER